MGRRGVPITTTEQYLIKLPYWDDLTEEERERVRQHAALQRFSKGELVHSHSGDCLGMVVVLQGIIRAYLLSEEGREVTLFRMYQGDPCVLSASCVIQEISFDTQMVAEEDAELLVVSSAVFGQLVQENIYVRCFMFELMTQRFSTVMWSMQQILFKGYDRRLAAFLVQEYDRTGLADLRMTHEQIAQHTSSAREVAARMLKRFAADGLVTMKRGSIHLVDLDGLRRLI